MRLLLAAALVASAAPAAAQVYGSALTTDPLRPQTQLELDRLSRQRLDLSAELQRQASQAHALETQRLRNGLLVDHLRTQEARRIVTESLPYAPAVKPAEKARIAGKAAADIGQIDSFLDRK
jgi:hypothetical protein